MKRTGAIVIDASFAMTILLDEDDGPAAGRAMAAWVTDGDRLVVPAHFWLEVVNALSLRHRRPGSFVLEAVHRLDTFGLETVDVDRALVILSIDLAERHHLSAYDAAYLAVASSLDASIATFDSALRRAAGSRVVRLGETRLSETPATYEHPVTWPSYRGASAYLSKLRAEAARPG